MREASRFRASAWPVRPALVAAVAFGFFLVAAEASVMAAGTRGGAPKAAALSCSDLARLSGEANRAGDRVIEAEGPVTASGVEAVPPYLVICDGTPRIACIMETPLAGADPGRAVHVIGRLSGGDRRMLVVDPCGASLVP